MTRFTRKVVPWLCLFIILAAPPAHAQLEDQLSSYTGVNATGYLQPLVDAFGADLHDALFHSAYIPTSGPRLRLEVQVMSVIFDDDDRTFMAQTEGDFQPATSVEAPTVIGSGDAVAVVGNAGTSFAFPGGFDLNSFAILVPQLRFGTIAGTEGLVRFFALDTGDTELGDIMLFGVGARHSLSQYLGPVPPLDVAVGAFWQTFNMGDDFIETNAFSVGVQASKRFATLEPYAGFSIDTFSLDVSYQSDSGAAADNIDLEFESDTTAHLTLGLNLNLTVLNVFGEYNIAGQNSFAFGLGLGI